MKLKGMALMSVLMVVSGLSGCSYLQQDPQAEHEAICKELSYRMTNYSSIMGVQDDMNNQVNQSSAGWQQTAEMARLQKSYHDHGCD